jgi:cell division protein FtsI (penicillin-binding protein 3)
MTRQARPQPSRPRRAEAPPEAAGRRVNRRAAVVVALLAAAMVLLLVRVFQLQRDSHAAMVDLAQQQYTMTVPLKARRGDIVDPNGLLLAGTSEAPSVFADPQFIVDLQEAAGRLADVLEVPAAEIYQHLLRYRHRRFTWLARRVPEALADRVRRLRIRGVGICFEPVRRYPHGRLAAHLIGIKGVDRGLTGLERQYEDELAGEDGHKRVLADAGRRPVWLAEEALKRPRHGRTLVLSIDANLQQFVEEALDELQEAHGPRWSTCILMDPNTGAIAAMACRPTYEPATFADASDEERVNRAISYPFEPGSIFKPFIAIWALHEKVSHLDETIFCHNGVFQFHGRRLRDHHPYGNLSFQEIVYRSSNIGMALLGIRLGKRRLYAAETGFGFGSRSGVDLPCEDAGIITSLARWNATYTTTSVPMGQEISATALQLVTAFAALANDGQLMRPYVVQQVLDPQTHQVERNTEPTVLRRVLPASVVRTFREKVLHEVVAHARGTGRRARQARYRLFGKTGTAQVARDGVFVDNEYVASFLCGGPLECPQLVCIVTAYVPDVSRGYYGGVVAAPIAGRLMGRALAYLKVPSDKPPAAETL